MTDLHSTGAQQGDDLRAKALALTERELVILRLGLRHVGTEPYVVFGEMVTLDECKTVARKVRELGEERAALLDERDTLAARVAGLETAMTSMAERFLALGHPVESLGAFLTVANAKVTITPPAPEGATSPSYECPGPDCPACSGEHCDVHTPLHQPCDCDVIERHNYGSCKVPREAGRRSDDDL